ncbi:fructose-1-phosphate kinase [Carnobacterium alterfunditum]|uniref:Tagatose-6-phosphate kinase n=1 Tax=Carnobacterium alterfunditum TaxID=28230 RepID=A0A1N6H5A1_9LACT|nr:1-phosphofructokinase [Carnobacterium alterfunditum]SIO14991.1 fructose-1-phosphate kinase [Carnobacterium alterfunditum]
MIYTVTLNPSIDYIVHVSSVQLGALNRMDKDLKLPGGKGINVSRVLNHINQPSTALGFLGGFTGNFISDWLEKEGVHTQFVSIEGDTRINVKLKSDTETELNAQGPVIAKSEADQLMDQIELMTAEDIIIFSGNKPPSLPEDFYQKMIAKIVSKKANFVIDTAGTELLNALAHKPLLVKPNHHELADLFGVSIESVEDTVPYGKKLIALGAQHALVSMAGDGALFFTGEKIYRATVPKGIVKNSVGAGDSMIAGFIGALVDTKDPLKAFKKSVATGSATAFSDDLATRSEIENLLKEVIVTEIT